MTEPRWRESIDEVVQRARFNERSDDNWWESARGVVETGVSPDDLKFLATVGLAELASQAHILDRDAEEPCMGQRLARERFLPETP